MGRTRAWVIMAAAVFAGLVAVVLASHWIAAQSQLGVNKVVVLAVDVQLGSRISAQMLALVDWPSGSVPDGAFNDPQSVDGRVAKTSLQRGEPVLESKLAPVGTRGGLSAVVAEGKRAITVRVNDVIGVAGFALPGNYVDIMVSTQQEGGKASNGQEHKISKIVLERILVLAVAQEASRDETKPKVVSAVTLEVTPEQAEKLDIARSVGTLSLVLRNQVDPQEARTGGATKAALFNEQTAPAPVSKAPAKVMPQAKRTPAAAAAAPQAPRTQVEMIKGMHRSTTEL
jgi:pilus assembly protein CpaB